MVSRKVLIGTGLSLGLGLAGCNTQPLAGFDPEMIQQLERNSANGEPSSYLRPLPTTREDPMIALGGAASAVPSARPVTRPTTGPNLDEFPIVRMSLHELIHRAVVANHDVKVAGYQPAIEGTRVVEAQSNFDPVFFTNIQYQQKNDLTGGQTFDTFSAVPTIYTSFASQADIGTFQTGVKQNLPSGGQIQLQYQSQYTWLNPQQTVFNPYYESDLTLQLTQPLLKNFGYDVNQATIVIARDTQKVSLLEFRKAVEQNAMDIEKTYWQLVEAEQDIQIQQELVAQTQSTYEILNQRAKQGLDVSQLQVSQAQTRLESRRGSLLQAKAHACDLSDQLKGLMSDPEFPVTSPVLILPADKPVETPMHFILEDEINTALENRFELGEQQIKIDSATATVTVAKNNLLPELNFVTSVGPQGVNDNLGSAITSNAQFSHWDFSVGLQLTVPIGERGPRAIWQRTLFQRMQAIEQYRALVEQISVEVSMGSRAVATAWQNIVQQRLARYAAEDALNAIDAREKANEPLRPEFVELKLDTQERLSSAQEAEAEAISTYNLALSQLEQAKGTLLRYNNVMLEEQQAKLTDEGLLR